jgi:iron complex outermembrane receptor protein
MSLCLLAMLPGWLAAQATLSGTLTDNQGMGLIGASIILEGTTIGTTTDLDGNYTVSNIPAGSYTVIYSYVGYIKQTRTVSLSDGQSLVMNLSLEENVTLLNEAVVVGYGVTQTKDLTGAVTSLDTEDFLGGNVNTPEQLVTGKVAGVQITSNGGAPGSGSRIRVRGGSSLNASNDPLIVIDGVPVDNNGIAGSANALNLINPDDIESFTVLKDASAAAIYGARAANGVILIETKKGKAGGDLRVEFSTNNAVTTIARYTDVMTGDEFRQAVTEFGTAEQQALLGEENTDWQREIFRTGFATDNDISFSGGIRNLPYRLGLEFYNENGILDRSQLTRYGTSLNLSPKFFDDHLSINANAKYSLTNNFFADQGAIGGAVGFDPTQPVFGDGPDFEALGGYWQWLDNAGNPVALAGKNPVALLQQREDISEVGRFIGNIQLDYKFHFLPELRANLNIGGDWARSNGSVLVPDSAASQFQNDGQLSWYNQQKNNELLEFYLNYAKTFGDHKVDATGGYTYQNWSRFSPWVPGFNYNGELVNTQDTFQFPDSTTNRLISFFGRLNYTFKERYLITTTLRYDGSSRFAPENRWGLFPSVALAWRLSEEAFMQNLGSLSNLKVRFGWGVTGQQDIFSDYPYFANYNQGTPTASYEFGGTFYQVFRPDAFARDIQWETTSSLNFGIDFGFNNNRFYGTLDYYEKNTKDLIAQTFVPAGTTFSNQVLTNIGSLENRGVELTLGYIAIDKDDIGLDIGANATWQQIEVTALGATEDPDAFNFVPVGGIGGATGNTIQIHSPGFTPFTFYAYEQLLGEDGMPIENSASELGYVDQNGDGEINADDLVPGKTPNPDVFLGMYANLRLKKWSAGFTLRGEIGNYVYNNVASQRSSANKAIGIQSLSNLTTAYFDTEFERDQLFSDYYIENASYLRMDNMFVGYNFGNLGNSDLQLSAQAIVQNAFVITGYSGLDPEVAGGIDNNIYPRPRVFSLNLNLRY